MNDENEPLSILRVVEVTVAIIVLSIICGAWAYSWLCGMLGYQPFWYGGG